MDHGAHVGLVDSHAEGDRRHDRLEPTAPGTPPGRRRAGPRSSRRDNPPRDRGPRGLPPDPRSDVGSERRRSPAAGPGPSSGARATATRAPGRISTTSIAMFSRRKPWMNRRAAGHAELVADVALHERRRRGGQGDDRGGAQHRQPLAEHAVVRAEIVAPLRDAVRLVDRDEHRLAPREELGETGYAEALRCDEQEVQSAGEVVVARLPRLGTRASRVDPLGAQAERAQLGGPDPPSARSAGSRRASSRRGRRPEAGSTATCPPPSASRAARRRPRRQRGKPPPGTDGSQGTRTPRRAGR